ncbi:nuclear transport factor 2 family protein [Pseudooceanicola sp.]|uniref:nuclear transport factor 2 family protein n=1 Tax=Pseudooceanicola sp. TaxID=1914328 RepID=UPI0035C6C5D6
MTSETHDTLPLPVVRYLAARTPSEIAETFTPDGVATDERRTHRGRVAIQNWREEADRVSYRQDILTASHEGNRASLTCRLTGDFPGSPVNLTYRFEIADGLVSRLEIS